MFNIKCIKCSSILKQKHNRYFNYSCSGHLSLKIESTEIVDYVLICSNYILESEFNLDYTTLIYGNIFIRVKYIKINLDNFENELLKTLDYMIKLSMY